MGQEQVTLFVAFVAGLLTFLSPCILPLIPSFIAYITGISFKDLKADGAKAVVRLAAVTHTLLFIAGFSVVFVLLLLSPLVGTFRDFVVQLPQIIDDISNNSSIGQWVDTHSTAPAYANAMNVPPQLSGVHCARAALRPIGS